MPPASWKEPPPHKPTHGLLSLFGLQLKCPLETWSNVLILTSVGVQIAYSVQNKVTHKKWIHLKGIKIPFSALLNDPFRWKQVLPQAIKWLLIRLPAVSSPVFVEVIDRASHYWFCLNSISWTDMWDALWSYRANAVSITAVLASGCFVWYGGACLSERTRQYLHLAPTPACLSKTMYFLSEQPAWLTREAVLRRKKQLWI